jgi:aryl-alcohol dehydrogenase-like predicted oxidoreductase
LQGIELHTRALGPSGLQVSELGLGCNNFGERIDAAGTDAVVHAALDAGVNFFDTADVYGVRGEGTSEILLGKALGSRRHEALIATKFGASMTIEGGPRNASRAYILQAVEASLARLHTDHIDVYWLHWPDPKTPMQETLRALDDLVRAGKVRCIGACNLAAWQLVEAEWLARELGTQHFVCAQNEYSLIERAPEKELLPALVAYQLALVPYFPLANGLLTGKYRRGATPPAGSRFDAWKALGRQYLTDANWSRVERLEAWCADHGHTLLELAFAWLLARAEVASVIAGASRPDQVLANARAIEWRITAAERAEVDALLDAA